MWNYCRAFRTKSTEFCWCVCMSLCWPYLAVAYTEGRDHRSEAPSYWQCRKPLECSERRHPCTSNIGKPLGGRTGPRWGSLECSPDPSWLPLPKYSTPGFGPLGLIGWPFRSCWTPSMIQFCVCRGNFVWWSPWPLTFWSQNLYQFVCVSPVHQSCKFGEIPWNGLWNIVFTDRETYARTHVRLVGGGTKTNSIEETVRSTFKAIIIAWGRLSSNWTMLYYAAS